MFRQCVRDFWWRVFRLNACAAQRRGSSQSHSKLWWEHIDYRVATCRSYFWDCTAIHTCSHAHTHTHTHTHKMITIIIFYNFEATEKKYGSSSNNSQDSVSALYDLSTISMQVSEYFYMWCSLKLYRSSQFYINNGSVCNVKGVTCSDEATQNYLQLCSSTGCLCILQLIVLELLFSSVWTLRPSCNRQLFSAKKTLIHLLYTTCPGSKSRRTKVATEHSEAFSS